MIPSDALVINTTEFQRVINKSLDFTAKSDSIVTIGIQPSRPETGYGYICASVSANKTQSSNSEICKVEAFKEKPNLATSESYLKANNYVSVQF